ncbi:BTAD domain-containing putative transcriptional regulator [Nitriliruptor alkaliphilus]|uniref:BTAD domain-containing putative transcriptional regulator n=1 Tax=Nitriliruptor alkaliphilus TaxID=427918 RepID=UPI000699168D|nr:BTAD domain-containing putative transcriptional regulator [Nitriliruptor alkaliphilus]
MEHNSRWLERPTLERRLDAALTHRLTTLTAAAGYGKSALLDRWGAAVGAVHHRLGPEDGDLVPFARHVVRAIRARVPDLPRELTQALDGPLGPSAPTDAAARATGLASLLSESLQGELRRDLVLVLDDIGHLDAGSASAQFLDMLLRSGPHRLHLVTASRTAPPFAIERLRGQQQVLEFTAADLTLDRDQVRRWTAAVAGTDGAIADTIAERTGGWPVAVIALARQLEGRTDATSPDDPVLADPLPAYQQLVVDAFDAASPEGRQLTLLATAVPHLSPALAQAVGLPPDELTVVHRAGLLLDLAPDVVDGYRATPAARAALGGRAATDPETAALVAAAVSWFLDASRPDLALDTLLGRDDIPALEGLLGTYGSDLATGRAAATLIRALEGPAAEFGATASGRRLLGLARHTVGDWDRAQGLLAASLHSTKTDATVAWRLGLLHHMRGELDEALPIYDQGRHGLPTAEAIICTAMYATARWLRGERDACAEAAHEALDRALQLGEDRPLASAHTVLAMLAALDGQRRANDAHYLRAIEHAERAGDVFQLVRIRVNRASHHIEEGNYTEALVELDRAGSLAEVTGFSPFTAVALSNRAEALVHLGRLEEAAADATEAVAMWRAIGSRLVVYGLEQVGMVQALRGDRAGAAATLQAAVAEAESASDAQGLVSSLAAFADVIRDDDPAEALATGRRAVAEGTGMAYVAACLATTRAAIAAGERAVAREHLERARDEAVTRRDAPALAAVTELRATLDGDEDLAREAVLAWGELDDPIARAGAELTVAEIVVGQGERQDVVAATAERVASELHAIGCRVYDDRVARLQPRGVSRHEGAAVTVQTLGGFRVLRDGVAMARSDWQSRKARLLIKLLASQHGRATSRDWLAEQLWPDTDREVADRRLRVLVSTVRGLLDPDRLHPGDHFLVSDQDAIHLDLRHVTLDVVQLRDLVEESASLDAQGHPERALSRWRAAEAAYTGVFCPEELYADWSVRTREELRTAFVQACTRVATADADAGRYDDAVRRWLRLLETDPYDERAHFALIDALMRSGRPAEARRRYRTYAERVSELGVEAVPFPGA